MFFVNRNFVVSKNKALNKVTFDMILLLSFVMTTKINKSWYLIHNEWLNIEKEEEKKKGVEI